MPQSANRRVLFLRNLCVAGCPSHLCGQVVRWSGRAKEAFLPPRRHCSWRDATRGCSRTSPCNEWILLKLFGVPSRFLAVWPPSSCPPPTPSRLFFNMAHVRGKLGWDEYSLVINQSIPKRNERKISRRDSNPDYSLVRTTRKLLGLFPRSLLPFQAPPLALRINSFFLSLNWFFVAFKTLVF